MGNINNLITLPPLAFSPPQPPSQLTQINGSASIPVSGSSHNHQDQDQYQTQSPAQDQSKQGQKYLVTCNIYDLDLKSRMKYKYWLQVEHELQGIYNLNNPSWRHCCKY